MNRRFFISVVGLFICASAYISAGPKKYYVNICQPDIIQKPVVDSLIVNSANMNQIYWNRQVNPNIEYYNIYKDTSNVGNDWTLIAKIKNDQETFFIDKSSFLLKKPCLYCLSLVDGCGNEIFADSIVNTIYLSIEETNSSNVKLKWVNKKNIEKRKYYILGGNSLDNMQLIDSVAALDSVYVDESFSQRYHCFYRIDAVDEHTSSNVEHSPNQTRKLVQSNIVSSSYSIISKTTDSTDFGKLKVFNDSQNKKLFVYFPLYKGRPYVARLVDMNGSIVFENEINTNIFEIETRSIKNGIYIIQVNGISEQQNINLKIRI